MPASAALGMIWTVSESGEELRVDPIQRHDASVPAIQGLRFRPLRIQIYNSPMILSRSMASKAKPGRKGIFSSFGSPAFSSDVGETRSFPPAPHDAVGVSGTLPNYGSASGSSSEFLIRSRQSAIGFQRRIPGIKRVGLHTGPMRLHKTAMPSPEIPERAFSFPSGPRALHGITPRMRGRRLGPLVHRCIGFR
jgi:hypothetical protein